MRCAYLLLVLVLGCGDGSGGDATNRDGGEDRDGDDDGARDGQLSGEVPTIGACPVFTSDDAWNVDVSESATSDEWTDKLRERFGDTLLHPDFGNFEDEHYGIPVNVVPAGATPVSITYDMWPEESDDGPVVLPSPDDIRIEGTDDPSSCDGDCHIVSVDEGACEVFEGWLCRYDDEDGYVCANGARFDLDSNSQGQRPEGWTSADAAGLSILAGLVRYEEAEAGDIRHAIRFTVPCTQDHYVRPASHQAVPGDCDADDPDSPPMGLRVRLRSDFDVSGFSPIPRAFLEAMKKYGMILADNGSAFYFQSVDDPRWTDDLDELKEVPADAFEAIEPGTFY